MTKATRQLIPKVSSLHELRTLAGQDDRYRQLAIVAAQNLGGAPADLRAALRWLAVNADETDEAGVVAEVNFCRDIIDDNDGSEGGML